VLTPADEHPHPTPTPFPAGWQENYFVLAWDDAQRVGFAVHLERFPDRGTVEVKVDVFAGDDVVSGSGHFTLQPGIDAGPVAVSVDEPYRRWRLRLAARGGAGRGHLGFVGQPPLALDGEGAELAVDVVLESPLGAVDHGEVLKRLALPGTERDHYETSGTWTGSVVVGDRRLVGRGAFVRDHTWGVRGYTAFDAAWWYPSVFDAGEAYIGGALVGYGDRWGGYAIVADRAGVDATTDVRLTADGALAPAGYTGTRMVARFAEREVTVTSTTRAHMPHLFPGFADRYYTNDAFSALEWDGRPGFGIRELNGFLDDAATARVQAGP
jgi:hypothetical protein